MERVLSAERRLGMSLTSGGRDGVPGRLLVPGLRGWIFFYVQGIQRYHLHFDTIWLYADGIGGDGMEGPEMRKEPSWRWQ